MTITGIEQDPITMVTNSSSSTVKKVPPVGQSERESNHTRDSHESVSQHDRVEISKAAQELSQSESSLQHENQAEAQSPFNRR